MSEYIIDICADGGFRTEIKEALIRCGGCAFCQKKDGIYRCDLHGRRVYWNSFCSFALIKDKEGIE